VPPQLPSRGDTELSLEDTGEMYMNDDAVQSVVANAASAFEPANAADGQVVDGSYLAVSPLEDEEAETDFSGFGDADPGALPAETADADAWDEEETYDVMDEHAPGEGSTAPPS